MKELFICEKCETIFEDFKLCLEHEKECDKENTFKCFKCGKTVKWKNSDTSSYIIQNQIYHINLGVAGYGSKLDGCNLVYDLCDDCHSSFIKSFALKDYILGDLYHKFDNYNWKDDKQDE